MSLKRTWLILSVLIATLVLSGLACQQFARQGSQPATGGLSLPSGTGAFGGVVPTPSPTINPLIPPTRIPGSPYFTPTPDAPHPLPTPRQEAENYTVQAGDTLARIAQRFGVSYQMVADANQLTNPNLIDVGLELVIPPPDPNQALPDGKIIPDSELVYGPFSSYFDIQAFVEQRGGYLARYREELSEGEFSNGADIVQRVAQEFSTNPRLLLAVLEYQSGWVTEIEPAEETLDYPIGLLDPNRQGLYRQLAYAANELNRGYYLWRVNGVAVWVLADGEVQLPSPLINAGTAGVQHFFGTLYGRTDWEQAISDQGLFATYTNLFGYPFDYTLEPLLPSYLTQPEFGLPFESGTTWAFTGGPHGGWGDGSAWAALDFAPPGDALGCVESDAWVTAIADGPVVRAENGAVVQDLDGDGLEQTGWTILYMHIEARERAAVGTYLNAGDRVGHPSCEGGFSTGTHLHLARRYNGEWLPADGSIPFVLDSWISAGAGREYDGYLSREGQTLEAWNGRSEANQIQR